MAVRIQLRRDTAANWVSTNPVLRAGELGIETDTLKIKIGNGNAWNSISNYANVVPSDLNTTLGDYVLTTDIGAQSGVVGLNSSYNAVIPGSSIIIEGITGDAHETTLTVTDPTADRTITFPDATGTVALTSDLNSYAALSGATFTGNINVPTAITFEGATADSYETTIQATDPTADRTIILPDAGGTVALTSNIPSTTDTLSEGTTNKYFTDERAQDAVAAAIAAGTHTNITITYDDDNNKLSFVGAQTYSDENAQDAVGNAVGTGLSYNDSTGAISVDTTAIQARVADVSDTEIGYLNGVTSAIQTQIDSKLALAGGTMTGHLTLSGAPESALHAATKSYVDNIATGLNFHPAVHFATSTNITTDYSNGTDGVGATLTAMSNGAIGTIDGHQAVLNDRVLVKAQTDAKQNGIYYVSNAGGSSSKWVLTRALDSDNSPTGEIAYGDFCFVQNGTLAGGYGYIVTTTGTITIGTTDINYTQFNAGQSVVPGNGLTEPSVGTLAIDTAITADLSTAQTLTNKRLTSPKINEDVALTATATELNTLDGITASTTELNYVDGVTSAIQTQLNAKASSADPTFTGTVNAADLTLSGNLIVSDPLISIGKGNTGNAVDIGLFGEYISPLSGDFLSISNKALTSNVATLTTTTEHGYAVGNKVSVFSVDATFNGVHILTSVTSTTFSFAKTASNVASTASSGGCLLEGERKFNGIVRDHDAGAWKLFKGVTDQPSTTVDFTQGSLDNLQIAELTASSITVGNVSNTEIGYLDGVTSSIQTQLDAKIAKSLVDAKGDILVASADNTVTRLGVGTNGYLLTANSSATNGVEWAAAPVSLPSQSGENGKYLTTDGTTASWASLVVPIVTGTATVDQNTAVTVDTTALSAFTSIEYMVSLKQGSKVRTSKVMVQTDGTSVDMTEFAITETGGTIAGVVVSAAVSSTNCVLKVTATDGASTNVTVKFSKVAL